MDKDDPKALSRSRYGLGGFAWSHYGTKRGEELGVGGPTADQEQG